MFKAVIERLHFSEMFFPEKDKRILFYMSRGNSVSLVSGYGLDDRAIEVRSPAEAKRFFL
jgi:hypothetical protein